MKKLLTITLALVMILTLTVLAVGTDYGYGAHSSASAQPAKALALTVPATTADYSVKYGFDANCNAPESALILKGSPKGNFDYDGWGPIFDLAGGATENVTYWHFVNTGGNANPYEATYMKLLFNEDDYFCWTPDRGLSTNSGGNNPGWVVKTPIDWELKGGYLLGTGKNFNLSNFVAVPGESMGSSAEISFSVSKELTETAAAYYAATDKEAPEFTFALSLTVDSVPYTFENGEDQINVPTGGNGVWGPFELKSDEKDHVFKIEYSIAESAVDGFKLHSKTVEVNGTEVEEGYIELQNKDNLTVDYTFTNDFTYSSETAAAFGLNGVTKNTETNAAWHFVSFNATDDFDIFAGQHYKVGTGKIVNGQLEITWEPGVKVNSTSYAFAPKDDAVKLAGTAPGQLGKAGKNGFGSLDYEVGDFVKIHFDVAIPYLILADLYTSKN